MPSTSSKAIGRLQTNSCQYGFLIKLWEEIRSYRTVWMHSYCQLITCPLFLKFGKLCFFSVRFQRLFLLFNYVYRALWSMGLISHLSTLLRPFVILHCCRNFVLRTLISHPIHPHAYQLPPFRIHHWISLCRVVGPLTHPYCFAVILNNSVALSLLFHLFLFFPSDYLYALSPVPFFVNSHLTV